jgi:hypothetical protein
LISIPCGKIANNKLQAPPDLKIGPNKFQITTNLIYEISNKIKSQVLGIF